MERVAVSGVSIWQQGAVKILNYSSVNLKNTYAIKVNEASPKWNIQNVNMWKKTLWEVAHLSGEVQSGSKYETEVLDEIVDVIYRKVGRKQVTLPHNLIGMTSLDKEIGSETVEGLALDMEMFRKGNPLVELRGTKSCLTLLNMTGCKKLFNREQKTFFGRLVPSTFRGGDVLPTFSFPDSLQCLFLKECNLDRTDSLPLSFTAQKSLQYLNLSNGQFDSLPCYDLLLVLRALDLSSCSRLKCLQSLPNTLAELYVYDCTSLEMITFKSHQFTLSEFGYEGCISLSEIEGFIKLVHVTKLDEKDLGHMKWLRKYQDQEVRLAGNDELTTGRNLCVQMLYEFDIMSTSLPDITDASIKHEHVSELSFLSFDVPWCPKNRRLKGLDVTFKYTISGDDDLGWFCKISTNKGVDLMYNPMVFGKPDYGEVGLWLSYWPIGNTLNIGDKVNVSIIGMSGVEVHECGVSLVYSDDEVAEEALKTKMGFGGDFSGFKLSTGAYYLCRRDFLKLMEVGRLTPYRFRILVGDTFDITEVRGWRKTGRPKQLNQSFTELKTVQCIIHGHELDEIYNITEMSKSSFVDKSLKFTSMMLWETMMFARRCKSKYLKATVACCALGCWLFFCNPDFNDNPDDGPSTLGIFIVLIITLLVYGASRESGEYSTGR
ncbi:hypothetical protein L1887_24272 [Cichorium endivia]|nr:hypothetical protein L1887_24272 [Cichorium endivia]